MSLSSRELCDSAVPLTKAERSEVLRRARGSVAVLRLDSLSFAKTVALMSPPLLMAVPFFTNWRPSREALIGFGFLWFALALSALFYHGRDMERRIAQKVRENVRELGYEICVSCGYWLRGLGDGIDQCPECGTDREPFDPVDVAKD